MARGGYSLTNYFSAGTGSNATPLTISLWFRTTNITGIQCPFHWGVGGSGALLNSHGIFIRGDLAGDPVQCFTYDGVSGAGATTSNGITSGQWHHVLAVFAGDADRSVYLDGVGKGSSTASRIPAGHNTVILGIALTGGFVFGGDIAEVAIWGEALTDADAVSLAAGASPLLVRPAAILAYREMPERESGGLRSRLASTAWTETGTCTQTVHPDGIVQPAGVIEPGRNPQSLVVGQVTENETLFAATVFPGAISAVPGLITENESLFAAAVSPGAISAATGLITENESLFAATVSIGAVPVSAGLITENESLFTATVSPGAVSVAPGLITENESLFAVTAFQGISVATGQITESESLFPATAAPGAVSIAPGLITENESLFPAAVFQGVRVGTGLITENESLFAVTVSPGATSITLGRIDEAETLFPLVIAGAAAAEAMADPGPVRQLDPEPRRPMHPAWRQMLKRLEADRLQREHVDQVAPTEPVHELEDPDDYLRNLVDESTQVDIDIDMIQNRLAVLDAADQLNVVLFEAEASLEAARENAEIYLELAKMKKARIEKWVTAIKAAIEFYYF